MRALLLALALSVPASAAEPPALQGGGLVSVGSHGYWRLGVTGDTWWKWQTLDPYAWGQLGGGNNGVDFSAGGGAWHGLDSVTRVKGGLGFGLGRLKDADATTGSLLLETGLERDVERTTLGGEFRLTVGSLPSARSTPGFYKRQRRRGRGTGADVSESYTLPELIGYVSHPFGRVRAGFDLGLAFPDYGDTVVSETFRVAVPVTDAVTAKAALTFEQNDLDGIYFTAGLSYRFQ